MDFFARIYTTALFIEIRNQMRRYITPAFCFLLLFLCNADCAISVNGPKPFDQILTSSFSSNWTASNSTALSAIANLKHVILLDAATKSYCLSINASGNNSSLTVTSAGNITSTYGSAMRCMFQLRDRNVESLSTTALNGNYSIHPELHSYSAIDGNATSSASTATNLMVRDIKSFYRSSNATYLVFTITGNATSAKIKATTRLALSSGNFSASGTWSASHWVMMNGTTVSLTTNEANATSFFMADATKLINFGVNAGSDFNPGSTAWQTNAFAPFPSIPAAPGAFLSSPLLTSHIAKLDPYYSKQLISGNNSSANATIAASSALDTIITTLAAEGASLRYDKSVYLAFRENALSHLFASQDLYNSQVGERTVAHVYFTNAANDAGIYHPYMVVASHNATPRPNFLVDVARPPGDGTGAYQNSTITRTAVIEYKVALIPLKDYGLVGNFTENFLAKSLASDAGLSSANYTVENYADIASMGVAIDGVVIYPAINNTLLYATAAAEITSSGAHVGQGGALHYHADGHGFNGNGINLYNLSDYTNSSNGTSRSHPPIIGFGYDGIALYGKYESSFSAMDGYGVALDAHGGHTHGEYGYHYHAYSAPIVGLRDTAGSKSLIGTGNFTQHYLMVGAWKGAINSLPVLGLGIIDNATTGRYVGKNGTVTLVPVVTSMTANGTVGSVFSASISATNSPSSYVVTSGAFPSGLSLNATSGVISGIPAAPGNGTVVVVRAINASGNSTGNMTFNIAKGNQTISGVASTLSKSVGSGAYSINASVTSNLTLSYASSNTGVATVANNGTVTVVGAGTTTLTVSQAGNTNYNAAASVTQNLTVMPRVPVVTSATVSGRVGSALSVTVNATNSPTNYITSGLPSGLTINSTTGVISGTPLLAGNGTIVSITATNAGGNGTGNLTFNIAKGNQTISGVTANSTKVFGSGAYSLNASTTSNLALSYASSNVNVATVVDGMVTVVGNGTTTLTISQAGDVNYNAATNVTQVLTVIAQSPVVTSSTINATVGSAFSASVSATNSPTGYAVATGTLPTGLTLNASTGLISGTPATANITVVGVRATNGGGNGTGNLTFNIAKGNQTINGVLPTMARASGSYSLNASVKSNLTLSYASSSNSVATIATNGTVTVVGIGTATLTVSQVGNSNYNPAISVTQNLTVAPAPTITSNATATGTRGVPFSLSINATNSPASYALTGNLTPGLTLNGTTGEITGIPTTFGNSSVVLSASNTYGNGTKALTITIANVVPTITSSNSTTAILGVPFSYQIVATNAPFTGFAATGTLPTGLALNSRTGIISGNATAFGNFPISLVAKNSAGNSTVSPLAITIAPAVSFDVTGPKNERVSMNSTATFYAANATASTPNATVSYQWYKNRVVIGNATTSNYTISNVNYSTAGSYSVQVTSKLGTKIIGSVTSDVWSITPTDALSILVYTMSGNAMRTAGAVEASGTISGYFVMDRAINNAAIIQTYGTGFTARNSLELRDDIAAYSTGPVVGSRTVFAGSLNNGDSPIEHDLVWVTGVDAQVIVATGKSVFAPSTMTGIIGTIAQGSAVEIDSFNITLSLNNTLTANASSSNLTNTINAVRATATAAGYSNE
jgi:hypothetical protein